MTSIFELVKDIQEKSLELSKELEKQGAKQIEKPKGRFKPEFGQQYWVVITDAFTNSYIWQDDEEDSMFLEIGNCYPTKERAQEIAHNRRVHVRLQELAGGFEPNWDDYMQSKYYFIWYYGDDIVGWRLEVGVQASSVVYFKYLDGDKVQEIQGTIDTEFGEGALKQYLTGGIL